MVMKPRLDQRQTQSLVMTPQLQQAIKLLQMTNLELSAFVEKEIQQNPILERDEGEIVDVEVPDQEDFDDDVGINAEPLSSIKLEGTGTTEVSQDQTLDVDYDNLYNNSSETNGLTQNENISVGASDRPQNQLHGNDIPNIEETLTKSITLREHLLEQLSIEFSDVSDRLIGVFLIHMLDDAGYLRDGIHDIASTLNCQEHEVSIVLEKLRKFDPPGVFAVDLANCLALQLMDLNRLDPAMQIFLDNLELLAHCNFEELKAICKVDSEDLEEMINEIKSLDPKPGQKFANEILHTIQPDVMMRPSQSGGWIIELNPETLPRVLVNNTYAVYLNNQNMSKKDKSYIVDQAQSANWLVKALNQRANTILKVATEIVRCQDSFFKKGVTHLKPLVLRTVADAIEMHESTVSRVTSNKYIATPRGIFEMKYFFTTAISATAGGEAHSSEAVRHKIKELIDSETAGKVFSDDKLVITLKKEGIEIARRTVAKYREAMGIGSSIQRRQDFKTHQK